MIVIFRPDVEPAGPEVERVLRQVSHYSGVHCEVHSIRGATRTLTEVYLIGRTDTVSREGLEQLPGVERVVRISERYRLIGRHQGAEAVGFVYNGVRFDETSCHLFAGLCAVDNRENVVAVAQALARGGVATTRMGAVKPRTKPHEF